MSVEQAVGGEHQRAGYGIDLGKAVGLRAEPSPDIRCATNRVYEEVTRSAVAVPHFACRRQRCRSNPERLVVALRQHYGNAVDHAELVPLGAHQELFPLEQFRAIRRTAQNRAEPCGNRRHRR